jgi:hypothetical protein
MTFSLDIKTADDRAAEQFAAQKSAIVSAINAAVEDTAKRRDYNDAASLASYVASTNTTWAAEAQAFVGWRDQVWQEAYARLAEVEAGDAEMPTIAEAVADMPEIRWP